MVWIIRPWEVIDVQTKWIFGIGIVAAALASVYFIIKLDLNNAVMSMVALFALTNGARAKSFREQGMVRESKWMLCCPRVFPAIVLRPCAHNFVR